MFVTICRLRAFSVGICSLQTLPSPTPSTSGRVGDKKKSSCVTRWVLCGIPKGQLRSFLMALEAPTLFFYFYCAFSPLVDT